MSIWLKRFSLIALVGFPFAVLGFRFGLFGFGVSYKIIGATLLLAAVVFLLGSLLSIVHLKSNPNSAKTAKLATILSLLPLAVIGSQIFTAKSLPQIHNISTDISNPPAFDKIVALRGQNSNPLEYKATDLAELQKAAYPNVKTLLVDDSPEQAYQKSAKIVSQLGWQQVNADSAKGIIEATQTTLLWGFKDDVVIRIESQGNKTAIDLRSVSRIGRSDLGANAKRISAFLNEYQK